MNCRPGDLAVFVRSSAGNEGLIVRCLHMAPSGDLAALNFISTDGPVWVIDRPVRTCSGGKRALARDRNLRPITPPPGSVTDSEVRELYSPRTVTPSAPCKHKTRERA